MQTDRQIGLYNEKLELQHLEWSNNLGQMV